MNAPIDSNHHKGIVAKDTLTGSAFAVEGNQIEGSINVSESAPTSIVAFTTNIPTAGSSVQLTDNTCSGVVVQAPSTNTGVVYVGGSDVSATVYGAELQPGQSVGLAINNTNKVYVDTATNGNDVAVLGS